MEMIELLDNLVDESDPDNDLPNSIHDFQTAERIRQQWPEHEWFHLVGLLHDIGKVMALSDVAGDQVLEQWAVVGDTFPVGCALMKWVKDLMKWVKEFNKFDLYSKGDAIPDVEACKPYYQGLMEKYNIGGKLRW
jgi:hypothetical protein